MSLTQRQKRGLAADFAELYTADEIKQKRLALMEQGGERITNWSDIGLSVGKQYEITAAEMLDVLRMAAGVKDGKRLSRKSNFLFDQ